MIDILIPCRTGGDKYLVDAVRSVERQDVETNVEIIFDSVGALATVRNDLLRRAKGDYVYYLDADDFLLDSTRLSHLVAVLGDCQFAWGDYECYVGVRDLTIYMHQPSWTKGPAIGSWLARREAFPVDPWQPMSETEHHRADWTTPEDWLGVYLPEPIYYHRVGWSKDQNSEKMPGHG